MSSPRLSLRSPQTARLTPSFDKSLGQVLLERGSIAAEPLLGAMHIAEKLNAPLAQVCLSEGLIAQDELLAAQSDRFAAIPIRAKETPPDPVCKDWLAPEFCLKHGVWPWMKLGDTWVVATNEPERFEVVRAELPSDDAQVLMGIASNADIEAAIAQFHGADFAKQSEQDVPEAQSCRTLHGLASRRAIFMASALAAAFAALLFTQANLVFALAVLWASLTLFAGVILKFAAFTARLWGEWRKPAAPGHTLATPPMVSLLVPLFKEDDIADALVARLSRLSYPKAKLEVLLILEARDAQTQKALRKARLPSWMRVITVPPGALTTKPRALNYARRFAKGEIIGVYDAEDSPAPDQIEEVVRHFEKADSDVVCLQGVLDYYNPSTNWLSRCFTIEYAAWFRILLPGLAQMGLPIPLGGTTVFFKRDALEELSGWDAHNVTEDADLGMRLARAGYRTELLNSVTLEEANCRFWPWVRQRSRWLKGYWMTYLTHMRRPMALLRDLGIKGFLGFQVFFLTTLSQFALSPILWSFWLVLFGLPHPLQEIMPAQWLTALLTCFIACEAVGVIIGMTAVASPRHRHLIPWVPTLMLYFPIGALAIYKAFWECLRRPFYWDKTSHGHSRGTAVIDHKSE